MVRLLKCVRKNSSKLLTPIMKKKTINALRQSLIHPSEHSLAMLKESRIHLRGTGNDYSIILPFQDIAP